MGNIIDLVESPINTDPRRGTNEYAPLNALAPENGAEIILELERQGMTAYSVPQAGQKVLDDQTSLSTLTVTLSEKGSPAKATTAPPSDRSGFSKLWHDSAERFTDGGRAIALGLASMAPLWQKIPQAQAPPPRPRQ